MSFASDSFVVEHHSRSLENIERDIYRLEKLEERATTRDEEPHRMSFEEGANSTAEAGDLEEQDKMSTDNPLPNAQAQAQADSVTVLSSKRKHFNAQEDQIILDGVSHNKNWDEIAANLPGRTAKNVENRYKRVLKKRSSVATTSQPSSPLSSSPTKQPSQLQAFSVTTPQPTNGSLTPSKRKSAFPATDETPYKQRKLTEGTFSSASSSSNATQTEESTAKSLQAELLEEQRRQLQELQDQLEARERELALREERLNKREQAEALNEQLLARAREALHAVLKENEMRSRMLLKEKVARDSFRLGHFRYDRVGAEFVEGWVEGQSFKDLKAEMEALEAEKAKLEANKKALAKRKAALADSSREDAEQELEDILIQEEILKQRLDVIKQKKLDLEAKKESLIIERALHAKELKRISDEENSPFRDFRVFNSRFLLLRLLGKGGFSEVYKAYDLQEFRYVACKIHQLNPNWPEPKKQNYIKHACREYNIHKSLIHPRVVRLYEVFEIDENSFGTVMELCTGGDLDTYLREHKCLPEKESRVIIAQIFQGLRYLNEQKRPVIHYDLKPGNILFDESGGVKITDFGLSKIMEENAESLELTSQGAGTYWYLPPECFEVGSNPPKISSKVDVWSAGVIFYQMLFGRKPFGHNLSQQQILQGNVIGRVSEVEFPQKPPRPVTEQAKEFIRKCLNPDQSQRPDVRTLCKDSYLMFEKKSSTPRGAKRAGSMPPPSTPSQDKY